MSKVKLSILFFVIGVACGCVGTNMYYRYKEKAQNESEIVCEVDEIEESYDDFIEINETKDQIEEAKARGQEIVKEKQVKSAVKQQKQYDKIRSSYSSSLFERKEPYCITEEDIDDAEYSAYETEDIDYRIDVDAFFDSDDNELSPYDVISMLGKNIREVFNKDSLLYGTWSTEDPDEVFIRNEARARNYRVTCIR